MSGMAAETAALEVVARHSRTLAGAVVLVDIRGMGALEVAEVAAVAPVDRAVLLVVAVVVVVLALVGVLAC